MMLFVAWLILSLAIVGHLVIVRALLNRGYELGLPQRLWQALVLLLISAAVAGPVIIVWCVGLTRAAVLRGGAWRDVPIAWSLYLVACAFALIIGAIVMIRRSRDSHIPAQLTLTSDVLDYTATASSPPATNGAIARIARLPG